MRCQWTVDYERAVGGELRLMPSGRRTVSEACSASVVPTGSVIPVQRVSTCTAGPVTSSPDRVGARLCLPLRPPVPPAVPPPSRVPRALFTNGTLGNCDAWLGVDTSAEGCYGGFIERSAFRVGSLCEQLLTFWCHLAYHGATDIRLGNRMFFVCMDC